MSANKLLVFFFLLVLSACSSKSVAPSAKPEVTGNISLEKSWSTFVGFGSSHRDLRYKIASDDKNLYVAGKQGRLYALDKKNGRRVWTHDLEEPISAGITIKNDKLLLGTESGNILAIDSQSKETLWSRFLQSELLHPPVTDGAVIVAQLNNGELYVLDINTGDIIWSIVTNSPALSQRGTATPLLASNIIVAGFATGKVLILSLANGSRIFQSVIGNPKGNNEVGRLVDVDASMYSHNGIIYSTAVHGNLQALSLADSRPKTIWSKKFSGGSGIIGKANTIYATSNKGNIAAFSAKTGEQFWNNDQMLNYFYNTPVLWQDNLVVADQLGYINLIDLQTGNLNGLYRNSPYAVQSDFLVEDNRLYVLDIGGFISALEVKQ